VPVKIDESTFRLLLIAAAHRLAREGRVLTVDSLRSCGARGGDARLMDAAERLAREGAIDLNHYNRGRNARRFVNAQDVAAGRHRHVRNAQAGDAGTTKRRRHPSRHWVREYCAATRWHRTHAFRFPADTTEPEPCPPPPTSAS
jgi:hypothetical protein